MYPIGGDVLDECTSCTVWVPADEIDERTGVCWWCELSSSSCSDLIGRLAASRSARIRGRAPTTGG